MAHYLMSDIHGEAVHFHAMLEKIRFSTDDTLEEYEGNSPHWKFISACARKRNGGIWDYLKSLPTYLVIEVNRNRLHLCMDFLELTLMR